eukprot:NODE_3648_length_2004_cov_7.693127.p1 GENE.NODE_3648_length_2004_cov_7.693127~~NODE_3648_length_2004_cov_7.693127.p1  ORF type:complete len:534 (-),score=79.26 NODE_3648_length_2004_cov_7.693127:342-1943(-)
MAAQRSSSGHTVAVVWFRKCLRIDDNAALAEAAQIANVVVPVFVLNPKLADPQRVSAHRYRFLLESLADLDRQLRLLGSRLFVLRGDPVEKIGALLKTGAPLLATKPSHIFWEGGAEPHARARDAKASKLAAASGVQVKICDGQTLYNVDGALRLNGGKAPSQMQGMLSLAQKLGEPPLPVPAPKRLPKPVPLADFSVPALTACGYSEPEAHCGFRGGEAEGQRRMAEMLAKAAYICSFEKPKTQSTAFDPPSTTLLSPYLMLGCVSARRFYHSTKKVLAGKQHSQPPTSLLGQIYFREIAYLQGASIPNYDRQTGNPACKQIPWESNPELLRAWEEGRTGYPFIDAVMRQLIRKGWIHHLARHAVACFLTRGDLWISWEEGRDVFDRHLLDADWSINNNNWLALSGVAPWSPPYFRVYHPVPKMDSSLNVRDPEGKYIREFVPELKNMPGKYIYAPWTAPLEVQKKAGCIVGKHYPKPVVRHESASGQNLKRFGAALAMLKKAGVTTTGGRGLKRGGVGSSVGQLNKRIRSN